MILLLSNFIKHTSRKKIRIFSFFFALIDIFLRFSYIHINHKQSRLNLVARARDPLWEESWGSGKKPKRMHGIHCTITIGSSTLGKRAIFKLLNDGALGVENDIARKNYVSSSFKDSCPGIKTLNHIESKPVKVFVMNIWSHTCMYCVIFLCIYFCIVLFVLCL